MIADPPPASDTTMLIEAARRVVIHRIKARARLYAKRPMAMEPLYPGLACASAARLIAIGAYLVERETRSPRRWFGFGGEICVINAKAALLLGRTRRRSEGAGQPTPAPGGQRLNGAAEPA
jgi:hypothetical protein